QGTEWNHHQALDWYVLDYANHKGVSNLIRDLNSLYVNSPQLYKYEFEPQGFQWIDCNDHEQSIISYLRKSGDDIYVVVLNLTPVKRDNYRIGVPYEGEYNEILNSDSSYYAGSNVGNNTIVKTDNISWMEFPYSLKLVLPPLGAIILSPIK
ncbi:MAG: alpha amylase C-terminal domain-containing protein, partial [Gammaproteobacteria bacterium]